MAHRDLKLENIRANLKENKVVLIDFGMAYIEGFSDDKTKSCGSLEYAPPEVLERDEPHINPFKSDVWSFSVVLFVLAHCYFPYGIDRAKQGKMTKIDRADARFSDNFGKVLGFMLNRRPSKRPSMRRLKRKVWFKNPEEEKG